MSSQPLSLQDIIRKRQTGGFVGRQGELARFQENLALPVDDPRRRFLFTIHGDAGVGKTFLVRQLMRLAREQSCVTAYVDESVFDTPAAMDTIAAEFAKQQCSCDEYVKQSETYRKHKHDLDADPAAPEGLTSTLTKSAVRIGLRMTEDIPIAGAVTKELNTDAVAGEVDRIRVYLSQKLRSHRDVRLVLSPLDELTPTLVKDLRSTATRRPIALFFDTYERSVTFLDHWLLSLLGGRYGDLPPNIVITIAGQHPLDINRWGDYLTIRHNTELTIFSESEARELLTARNITDPAIIEVILGLTGRLPVLVAMLAEKAPGSVDEINDPSDDAVQRFLRWEKDEQRRTAARRGALPRRLDREVFAVLTGAEPEAVQGEFSWLLSLPFVSEQADGYRYHDVVRDAMLRVQRRRSQADWQQRHTALADHYRTACDALATGWQDSRWQAYAIEEHYHQLCARSASALPAAIAAIIEALHNQPLVGLWAAMIAQAGRDSGAQQLVEEGEKLSALVKHDDRAQLLSHLINEHELDDTHRALAYWLRAFAHRVDANYDAAVADYDRAIDLEPENDVAIAGRGEAYRLAGRYAEALVDFTRAIEIDPEYQWAIGQRGETHRLAGRYTAAIADLGRAFALDPEDAWAIASRAQAYQSIGQHDQAIADLSTAIDLDPNYKWAISERGSAHRHADRYDDAIADFNRALEIDPEYDTAIANRAETYLTLGQTDAALADIRRASEIDPEYGFYHYAIWLVSKAAGLTGDLDQHLVRATELDRQAIVKPGADTNLAFHLAICLRARGEIEPAAEQIRQALPMSRDADDVINAIMNLDQLREVTGCEVADLIELLRAGLPEG